MSEFGVRVQQKGQVTIPRQIRKKLDLKQGDLVIFVETDSGVIVKPASVIAAEDQRLELKAIVNSIRKHFKNYSAEEIESLVNDAIRDAREKRS
jgi:antitoxin PrlF